ncbi:MAG: hypothetical protein H6622_06375 [Halobacteriovoraceae bacterium]|nr:hypothetical protein [Halobacteriovoraceae bacterium]
MFDNANSKFYFNKLEKNEYENLFKSVVKNHCEIEIWHKDREDSVEQFKVAELSKVKNGLILKKSGPLLKQLIKSPLTNNLVLLKINFEKYLYFSAGYLTFNSDNGDYTIQIDHEIFKSQQRQDYRWINNNFNYVRLIANNSEINVFDISAGGLSIFVNEKEINFFAKGTILENCVVYFQADKFVIPNAEIVGHWDLLEEEKVVYLRVMGQRSYQNSSLNKDQSSISTSQTKKVGIKFLNLTKEVEEGLYRTINQAARVEAIKKNLLNKKAS